MKVIDIISSSRKVMDTTFSLFLSGSHVKSNTTVTRCMDILKEVNSIMKLIINYLLRNFEDSELVTSTKIAHWYSKLTVQNLLRTFYWSAKQDSS